MIGLLLAVACHSATSISVSYPKELMGQFTGRIYVFVAKDPDFEPRLGPEWKHPGPILVADVKKSKPDTDIPINDADATGLSAGLSGLAPGDYTFQAVINRNPASPRLGDGDGNLYSMPVRARVDSSGASVKLVCDQSIDEPTVHPSATVKIVELESIPLSNAQRRSVIWRAAVVLPNEFASQPSRKFPILLDIPDRGDSYANYPSRNTNLAAYRDGKPFIFVRVDPESATGYHYMANSANNGPYAKALVEELLPYVAKEYHGNLGDVVVSGTGAGGWSALWLQISQPDAFVGCWAIRPDAVDFHYFRGLDLYSATNALHSESGALRPWTRDASETWATHAAVENVLRGFWISGWESDFSPKGKNGSPVRLFDRSTGQIDPVVSKAWQAYDLDAYVKENWMATGAQLGGKLHIYAVADDRSFRSDAVRMLQGDLSRLGARATIELLKPSSQASAKLPSGVGSLVAQAEAAACYPGR